MKPPIFVRTLSKDEREALEAGLHSSHARVRCRCQILLASSRGESAAQIAKNLGCGSQPVRNAIHDLDRNGLGSLTLTPGSSSPRARGSTPVEPMWVHAELKVVEPAGLLTAHEPAERVCEVFG